MKNLYIGRLPTKNFWVFPLLIGQNAFSSVYYFIKTRIKVDLDEKVGNLSISYKQMIEIAKVLISDVKIIIMDEPTPSLTSLN